MRIPLPLNGRDIATGAGLWVGLYLIVSGRTSRTSGFPMMPAIQVIGGLLVLGVALALIMPRVRPWPLVQIRLRQQRHHLNLPISLGNRVALAMPAAIRSAIGILCGQWLTAAIAARLFDTTASGGQLVALAPLSTVIIVMIDALIGL